MIESYVFFFRNFFVWVFGFFYGLVRVCRFAFIFCYFVFRLYRCYFVR